MTNGLKAFCVPVIVIALSIFLARDWACLLISRVFRQQQGSLASIFDKIAVVVADDLQSVDVELVEVGSNFGPSRDYFFML